MIDSSYTLIPNNTEQNNATIKVIGVGGGGCNAVTRLFKKGIKDVELLICNTDMQALRNSPVPEKLQLGTALTRGLGAGCDPEKGRNAALESLEEFKQMIGKNIEMVFITAGMGGGTGTGAAPVIAKTIKEMGLLTVGVITYPFLDEGREALERAYNGMLEFSKYTDSILIVDNQKMYEMYPDKTLEEAYSMADNVLDTAVRGITNIIVQEGFVNVDMNDLKTVMKNSGMAIASIGNAKGENRAMEAVESAFNSPLLNDFDLRTARNLIVNITCRQNGLTMGEQQQIMEYVHNFTGQDIDKSKKGIVYDENMDPEEVSVTIVATGFKFHLTPPTKRTPKRNEEDILVVNSQVEDNGNSIIFAAPFQQTDSIRLQEFNPAFTAIYTADSKVIDFETEPALVRRERLKREFAEKNKE